MGSSATDRSVLHASGGRLSGAVRTYNSSGALLGFHGSMGSKSLARREIPPEAASLRSGGRGPCPCFEAVENPSGGGDMTESLKSSRMRSEAASRCSRVTETPSFSGRLRAPWEPESMWKTPFQSVSRRGPPTQTASSICWFAKRSGSTLGQASAMRRGRIRR